jgi:hypothetical protein
VYCAKHPLAFRLQEQMRDQEWKEVAYRNLIS